MAISLRNNITALNANAALTNSTNSLQKSLQRINTGLAINTASDNSSGMAIADSLRGQHKGLTQAIKNANDAIGVVKIADAAMEEQILIVDTIRQKAIQAAQDTQTTDSRKALQADIVRLLEELDNISQTTSFNGQSLLSGGFVNKNFQIGAYSNETVGATIGGTSSNKIGQTRFITGAEIIKPTEIALKFLNINGMDDMEIESTIISTSSGTGIGALAENINKYSNDLQVRASFNVLATSKRSVGPTANQGQGDSVKGLVLNGINLGNFTNINDSDSDNKIISAINYYSAETGIDASIDSRGFLQLSSSDGRGIKISAKSGFGLLGFDANSKSADGADAYEFFGRLTLRRNDARDINVVSRVGRNGSFTGDGSDVGLGFGKEASSIINLRSIRGGFSTEQACAMGAFANKNVNVMPSNNITGNETYTLGAGVTTYTGAQSVVDIANTARKMLDKIRSDIGSTQLQLEATVRNITSTRTNVKFSESQIRDTDFGDEIQNFKLKSSLVTASNYALAQSNTVLESIQKLLRF